MSGGDSHTQWTSREEREKRMKEAAGEGGTFFVCAGCGTTIEFTEPVAVDLVAGVCELCGGKILEINDYLDSLKPPESMEQLEEEFNQRFMEDIHGLPVTLIDTRFMLLAAEFMNKAYQLGKGEQGNVAMEEEGPFGI